MIRNFEIYTGELSIDEYKYILPRLFNILLLAIGKENAITNKQIVKDINIDYPIQVEAYSDAMPDKTIWIKTSEPRIRHMIHVLRVSDTIPFLIATSHGYYISNDKEEIETYMGSIDDRLRSIYDIRRCLKRQMKEWGKRPEAIQREISFANGELNY